MLRSAHELKNYTLQATDGEIGNCVDFLFDEENWDIHFMVADTGTWLKEEKVLIGPDFLESPDWSSKKLPVDLSRLEIKGAPKISENLDENDGMKIKNPPKTITGPYYRVACGFSGVGTTGLILAQGIQHRDHEKTVQPIPPQFIRSVEETLGFDIETIDGHIGHVSDIIFDDTKWAIRYVVVSTRNFLPGRKVLIDVLWVHEIRIKDRKLLVNLSRNDVKNSPEFDPEQPVNEKVEKVLYDYYGRPVQ